MRDKMSEEADYSDIKSDELYRNKLSTLEYYITRESGTERAYTGKYNLENRDGKYYCICCNHLLFNSDMKYESMCGWPSFHTEHKNANIDRIIDNSHGMKRIEVRCNKCNAHLGHVFDDGPKKHGGERYCINSASLKFVKGNK